MDWDGFFKEFEKALKTVPVDRLLVYEKKTLKAIRKRKTGSDKEFIEAAERFLGKLRILIQKKSKK